MDGIIPYCGPAPVPSTLWGAWNLDAVALAVTFAPLAALLLWRLKRVPAGLASFGLALAFISPLCALTVALFSARGLHHLVLLLGVAPALAAMLPRLPSQGWAGAGFALTSVFLWLWHLPAVYTLAWNSAVFYWVMQAGFILSATLFWAGILRAEARAGDAIPLGAAAQMLGLAGQMGLIGALLTFAPRPLYEQHLSLTPAFGLDPLADQQLAGLIMWVPGMLPLAVMAGLMLWRGWRKVAIA
ncbi:MAG: cytochrome c oxidase assembly protein [Pararhodobacter sp.]